MDKKPYLVRVWDNFHYEDEDEAYNYGEFETYDEALAAAKAIVDRSLQECLPGVVTAGALYKCYVTFGEDPSIIGPPETPRFYAWGYAEARSKELLPPESDGPEPLKSV